MQAHIDIPPVVRGVVWSIILGVDPALESTYATVDKDAPHMVDGQLDRDIPRCHQVCCLHFACVCGYK